jgi:hypothetical protein
VLYDTSQPTTSANRDGAMHHHSTHDPHLLSWLVSRGATRGARRLRAGSQVTHHRALASEGAPSSATTGGPNVAGHSHDGALALLELSFGRGNDISVIDREHLMVGERSTIPSTAESDTESATTSDATSQRLLIP